MDLLSSHVRTPAARPRRRAQPVLVHRPDQSLEENARGRPIAGGIRNGRSDGIAADRPEGFEVACGVG
jgi:hypothetical protein